MKISHTFLKRYKVKEEIGSGSFGRVYKLHHLRKNKFYALKIDIRLKGNVLNEAKILSDLQGGVGIPKLYKYGLTDDYSYMIIELLDCTLESLLKKSARKFSLATVVSVMLQLIDRIEFIHSKGYLHRDIKPQQILIGMNPRLVYLTDFGLARRFEVNHYHVSYNSECSRTGNSTFSSLNNHNGARQSRRDDLESLAYIAVYLLRGSLPWQVGKKLTTNAKWENASEMKSNIPVEEICNHCPTEFGIFLKYCRSLKFEEKPDYLYISQLFLIVQKQYSLEEMHLQWVNTSSEGQCKSSKLIIPSGSLQQFSTSSENCLDKEGECSRKIKRKTYNLKVRRSNCIKSRRNATSFQGKSMTFVNYINGKINVNSFAEEQLIETKHTFNENEFNSLQTTPKHILPEMKNRKKMVFEENEEKRVLKCNIF